MGPRPSSSAVRALGQRTCPYRHAQARARRDGRDTFTLRAVGVRRPPTLFLAGAAATSSLASPRLLAGSRATLRRSALSVPAEFLPHRRQDFLSQCVVVPGTELSVECRRGHFRRHRLLNGRLDGPTSFARVLHKTRVAGKLWVFTQITRGDSSFATKSSFDVAGSAPWSSASSTRSPSRSKATHSCPPAISLQTMLPPIRPNPIMPTRITFLQLLVFLGLSSHPASSSWALYPIH